MFSVALCTYNGSKFLSEQLDSLRSQTLAPAEVHVGDDGSTDDTLTLLTEFKAPFPVIVTRNERNLGWAENFIQTALRCSSEWIAFCDQDDVWYPQKLERCARLVANGPKDTKLVVHNARLIGDNAGLMDADDGVMVHPRLTLHPAPIWAGFRQVFHRGLLEIEHKKRTMPWREERYSEAHDAWVPLLAGATGSIVITGEPLADHRRHGANTTQLSGDTRPPLEEGNPLAHAAEIMRRVGLAGAAAHYAKAARKSELRARINSAASAPAKLRALGELLALGGYKSGGYENFGRRALFTDIRTAMSRGGTNESA